jgi:putative alpha-1,2-mannosidase
LNPDYYKGKELVIKTINNSENNIYVKNVKLNNKAITNYKISHKEIIKGGLLVLEMTDKSIKD